MLYIVHLILIYYFMYLCVCINTPLHSTIILLCNRTSLLSTSYWWCQNISFIYKLLANYIHIKWNELIENFTLFLNVIELYYNSSLKLQNKIKSSKLFLEALKWSTEYKSVPPFFLLLNIISLLQCKELPHIILILCCYLFLFMT